MIILPNPLPADQRSLQQLASSCAQDVVSTDGVDYISAWRKAKILYPSVFEAIDRVGDGLKNRVVPPIISNEDRARIAKYTPSPENKRKLGLHINATEDEYNAAANGAGDLDSPDYEKAFDKVSSLISDKQSISGQAADYTAGVRHPNLKRMADTQKAQRDLQANQSDNSEAGNPQWGKASNAQTPWSNVNKPANLNTGPTGTGCFKAAMANDDRAPFSLPLSDGDRATLEWILKQCEDYPKNPFAVKISGICKSKLAA